MKDFKEVDRVGNSIHRYSPAISLAVPGNPALPRRGPRRRTRQTADGRSIRQTVTHNNGVEMPILTFGVFQIPEDEKT